MSSELANFQKLSPGEKKYFEVLFSKEKSNVFVANDRDNGKKQ